MSCSAKRDPNGTWHIQYRWTDWTGTKKKSQKRGFKTKKELQQTSDPTMTLNPLSITAPMIRKWQGEMIDKGFKPTYLKTINNQLSSILN